MILEEYIITLVIFLALGTALLSFIISRYWKILAISWNIVDDPSEDKERKLQNKPVPLLTGNGFVLAAIFATLIIMVIAVTRSISLSDYISEPRWVYKLLAAIAGSIILLIGGFLDDTKRLKPIGQFSFVLTAILLVVISGISIEIPMWLDLPKYLVPLFTVIWLFACVAATKFLDGLDGLVSVVGIITFFAIAATGLIEKIAEPLVSLFAIIWAFALIGFLPLNFPKARSYMGEGASYVVGFMIGILSILSHSKVLTSSTAIGYFIFDLIIIWFLRLQKGKNPLTFADRTHIHHRLQDIGLTQFQTLVVITIVILFSTHLHLFFAGTNSLLIVLSQPIILGSLFLINKIDNRK
jgi:UDP-GlcNAc:undecaprenyl-phosphate/decaprenyl-phosphate GlcNAc-1-phosphate transferase